MAKKKSDASDKDKLSASEQQLKAISQQLRATEEELRKQNEFLNNVLDALANPFYVVDANDYTVKLANSAANFGTLKKDSRCYALSHKKRKPCRGAKHPCPLDEIKKTKKPVTVEHIHYDKDGNCKNVEVHAHPIFDSAGKISDMIEYCLDITKRKKTEERLLLYAEIMTNMSEGVYAIRAGDGAIVYTNPKFEEMFGYGGGELIGKHVSVVNAPTEKSSEKTAKQIIRVLNEKGWWRGEICNIKKDGTPFWCYASVSTFVHPEHGKVWVSTHTDITERKRAEQEITKLAKFPSENPNPVLRIAKDCTILYANAASLPVLQTWRCEEGERIPDPCCRRVEEALGSGEVCTFEFECNDGRIFLVALAPVPGGEYVNAYGIDITERKRAEEAMRESEERFRQFFENEPEYCYMISPEGTILDVNRAALKALGYKKEELVGRPLKTIYAPESLTKVKRLFPKWKKTGRIRDEELVIISKTGEKRIVLLSADAVRNEDGEILRSVSIQRDITERKRAEDVLWATNQQLRASQQQLRSANQQLRSSEQQLKAANQQLRASEQQLLAYQGQLKSLASQLTLTEEHERHRIATDLHASIGQSLVMSKLKLDELRASGPPAEVSKSLEEVCKLLDETIGEAKTLVFDLSSPILYELGFETAVAEWLEEQIEQKRRIACEFEDDGQAKPLDDDIRVLLFRDVRELLINVVKHARAQKVKVSVRKVGGRIKVAVEDDGWGFDPKKVAARATEKGGFGLFSIRERLEQLGGHLEIKSAPGCGSKVTMTAPLKEKTL